VSENLSNELKALYHKGDAPAWIWDPDFKRISWGNDRAASFWGEPDARTLPDRWFDANGDVAQALGAVAGNTPVKVHIPLPYQGATARIATRITPLELSDGRRGLFILVDMPIEIGADASFEAFELTDALPQVIATFTGNGQLLHQNAVAKDVFGAFSTSDSDGAPVALSYWLGGEHHARRFVDTVMATSDHSVLHKVQTRFGPRTYRLHAKRLTLTSANSPAFVVTFMDTTQSVSAEPQRMATPVSRAEVRFKAATPEPDEALVDAGRKPQADFTWKMDQRSRLIEISEGIGSLIGVSHKDLLGRTWVNISDTYGIDFDGRIDASIDARKPWRETVLWPTKQGSVLGAVKIEFSAEPVKTTSGKFAGFKGYGRAVDMGVSVEEAPVDEADLPTSHLELTAEEEQAFRDLGHELSHPRDTSESLNDEVLNQRVESSGHDLISVLKSALDEAPLCYLIHRNFHILYANKATASLFGFDSSDEMDSDPNLLNLFPAERVRLFDWQSEFDDEVAGVGRTERSLDLTGKKQDGSEISMSCALSPLSVDDGFAVQMILSEKVLEAPAPDVPAAISDELLASHSREAELHTILDTATDGIATLDEDGKIVSLNKSAQAIFGRDKAEVVGQKFTDLLTAKSKIAVEDYLSGLSDNSLATVFNDGREVVAVENKGGHIPLFLTIGKMPDGNPSRFCTVMRDMTQWKKAEENLKKAIDVAERASTQKSEFLAKISHELRTPLNSIIGFSEVMAQEQFGELKNDRYRGYVNDIHSSGKHLLSLILDLSKVEAGKLELKFTSVDLNEIILKSVSSLQNDANRERIVIRNSLNSDLPNVVADERSCRQIVLNLLSNAIKFTKGGGQVIVSSSLEETGEVKISVRDTGIGMSKKDINYALEPFRQITTSSTGSTAGTGLGLPLTKALTEANRARFHIESKPNSGTLVEITFPTARVLAE